MWIQYEMEPIYTWIKWLNDNNKHFNAMQNKL